MSLLLFDEPSTGVDYLSRKDLWRVIREEMHDKIVLLTSHDLDECDALGDTVSIMHKGVLKASGTSLFLKNSFGDGYRLRISGNNCGSDDMDNLVTVVKSCVPGAKIVTSVAGCVTVSLKRSSMKFLPALFERLGLSATGDADKTTEWSIANTTLEEVFLKICDINEETAIQAAPGDEVLADSKCQICKQYDSDLVTLFTKTGLDVQIDGVVCRYCAGHEARPVESDMTVGQGPVSMSAADDMSTAIAQSTMQGFRMVRAEDEDLEAAYGAEKYCPPPMKPTFVAQVSAIYMKNAVLQMRQRKMNICSCLLVLAVLLSLFINILAMKTMTSGGP